MSFQSFEERAKLAREVYLRSFDYFESFQDDIGMHMTYLLGAILDDKCIELSCFDSKHQKIVEHLRKCFPAIHPVWEYIHLEF